MQRWLRREFGFFRTGRGRRELLDPPANAGSIGKLRLRRMIDWVETTELNPPVPSLAGHLLSAIL